MIELVDTMPDINVQPAEYKRLLGYPRDVVLTDRARELADAARAWYARNGRPWLYARQVEQLDVNGGDLFVLDGVPFSSKRLHQTLSDAEAQGAVIVAVSAGPEVEAEAQRLWLEEKPDEYFFTEIFGSAVVEHLVTQVGARLCAWADAREMAVLPHYSPGYPDWEISEQPRLLELICRTRDHKLPRAMEAMESGMLRPKKSLLAVFGLTHKNTSARRLTPELIPCANCSLAGCQYRRASYERAADYSRNEASPVGQDSGATAEAAAAEATLDHDAKYLTNVRALRRWIDERLTLDVRDDGSIDALFRYDGTTCSNTGRAMQFHYTVSLGPREQGYPIRAQHCGPAPGDEGHRYMCRYMNNAEHLMVAIDREKPLLGQRLNDVLSWQRPMSGAGCYCEPGSRKHKWGLALETIHYALVQRERAANPVALGPERLVGLDSKQL